MQMLRIGMFVLFGAHWAPIKAQWALTSGPRPIDGPNDRAQNPAHLRVGAGWALGFVGQCGGLFTSMTIVLT